MSILFIPQDINVRLFVDPDLLALLNKIVDQRSDRAEASKLASDVNANASALAAAIPKT